MTYFKYTRLLLAVAVGLSFQTATHAIDFEWVGSGNPATDFFSTGSNWFFTDGDPNTPDFIGPLGESDDGHIDNGDTVIVRFAPGTVDDLDVDVGTLHVEAQTLPDGVLSTNDDIDIRIGGTFIVEGVVNVGGDFKPRGGLTQILGDGILNVFGNDVQNFGPTAVIEVSGNGFLNIVDNLDDSNNTWGTMTLTDNAFVRVGNGVDLAGPLTISGNALMTNGDDYDIKNNGVLLIEENGTLLVFDNYDIESGGTQITTGNATLTINADIQVANNASWTNGGGTNISLGALTLDSGSAMTFVLDQPGAGVYNAIQVQKEARLGGDMTVEFDKGAPGAIGATWSLIKAETISGRFDSITLTGAKIGQLGPNRTIGFRQLVTDGGFTSTLQIIISQQLELQIDRNTGNASIVNVGSSVVEVGLDGYQVESEYGGIDAAGWNSLAAQGVDDPDGWFETGAKSSNFIAELNPTITHNLVPGASVAIGAPYVYDLSNAVFGQDIEDHVFSFINGDGTTVEGLVTYTGDIQDNNIVLTIDPVTGDATIQNESSFEVAIDFYNITSADSSLDPAYNSLQDQGEQTWLEANPNEKRLSELMSGDPVTLHRGYGYFLDDLFQGATQDVKFEFLMAGSTTFFEGVVLYGTLPTNLLDPDFNPADSNNDGVVDGLDLIAWEGGYGTTGASKADGDLNADGVVDGKDFLEWQLNVGQVGPLVSALAAVPEPTSLVLLVAGALGFAGRRRRR